MRLFIVALLILGIALADASPRRVDLGKRSNLLEKKTEFDTRNPRPELNTSLSGTTLEMQEWHSEFSSIGQRKSPLQGEKSPLTEKVMEMDTWEKRNVELKVSPNSRRRATVGNWNNMKEQVMSQKFTHTELRTPEGRRFQQMVDEVSLRDINRFQVVRNKTDDGIPTVEAGSDEALTVKE